MGTKRFEGHLQQPVFDLELFAQKLPEDIGDELTALLVREPLKMGIHIPVEWKIAQSTL